MLVDRCLMNHQSDPYNVFLSIGVRFTDGATAVIPERGEVWRRRGVLGPDGLFCAFTNSMLA
jgi:hypothetical protein